MAEVLFDPAAPGFVDDPYPVYARLRSEAPVYNHPAGFVVLSHYDDVAHALRSAELFSSAAMGGGPERRLMASTGEQRPLSGALISQDPPIHTVQRNIVSRGFTPRRIAALEPRIESIAKELLDAMHGGDEIDVIRDIGTPLPIMVIAELLGLDPARRDDFKRWSTALVQGTTQATRLPSTEEKAILSEFAVFIRETVEERRHNPGDDLISTLVNAEEEDGVLDAAQVEGFASLLLVAGAETTTNLVGNALLALLAHPEELERLRAEPERVDAVLDETLRWDSPVQLLFRLATRDMELQGEKIARGSRAIVLLGSGNRDPRQFPDADRFDPDRDSRSHLGFGLGHHFCLGSALARLEGRIVVKGLLERFPRLSRVSDRVERPGSFLIRGPSSLPLATR